MSEKELELALCEADGSEAAGLASCSCRALVAEVRRLREALTEYGEHRWGPDHRHCPRAFLEADVCTCGLAEAIG